MPEAHLSGGLSGRVHDRTHIYPVRVYYEDTDAVGIVYHANYLLYAERARTEMMRLIGIEHSAMRTEEGVAFAVRSCEIDFRAPARLDDTLEVQTRITDIGGATMKVEQTIRRLKPDGGPADLVRIGMRLAFVNNAGRPVRMPGRLRDRLQPLLND